MKKMLFIIVFSLPLYVNAGWTGSTTIKRIHISDGSGVIYIETQKAIINPANCSATDMYAIRENSVLKSEIYSAVLSAGIAQKNVSIEIDSSLCENNRPTMRRIDIFLN